MPKHSFNGKLTLWSTAPTPPDAKPIPPVNFEANFGVNGTWQVAAGRFRLPMPDVNYVKAGVPLKVTVIATNDQEANGTWEAESGEMTLDIELLFTFTSTLLPFKFTLTSRLKLTLDSTTTWELNSVPAATATGHALNTAAGTFALAGLGLMEGEALNGEHFMVLLEGTLTPPLA